jgi:hypothetical protein
MQADEEMAGVRLPSIAAPSIVPACSDHRVAWFGNHRLVVSRKPPFFRMHFRRDLEEKLGLCVAAIRGKIVSHSRGYLDVSV